MSKKPEVSPATKQALSKSPQDMPDRGGSKKPTVETGSTRVKLTPNKEFPFAYTGAKPGMGEVDVTATRANLSRTVTDPYGEHSATRPLIGFGGKKHKKG